MLRLGLSKRHKEIVRNDVVKRQRRSRRRQTNPKNSGIRFRTNFPGKFIVNNVLIEKFILKPSPNGTWLY